MSLRLLLAVLILPLVGAGGEEGSAPPIPLDPDHANVTNVKVLGSSGSYLLSVTIASPDQGCGRYADWWEVVGTAGELFFRRILRHSHVNEQPFTRSGGPVPIPSDREVIVRAHMKGAGYGGVAMQGSAEAGFLPADLSADFAGDLADEPPQPEDCAF